MRGFTLGVCDMVRQRIAVTRQMLSDSTIAGFEPIQPGNSKPSKLMPLAQLDASSRHGAGKAVWLNSGQCDRPFRAAGAALLYPESLSLARMIGRAEAPQTIWLVSSQIALGPIFMM